MKKKLQRFELIIPILTARVLVESARRSDETNDRFDGKYESYKYDNAGHHCHQVDRSFLVIFCKETQFSLYTQTYP